MTIKISANLDRIPKNTMSNKSKKVVHESFFAATARLNSARKIIKETK